MTNIIIGGDTYPAGNIQKYFIKGDADAIFHDLSDEICSADLSIVNLECPLVSNETPIDKAGPILGADIKCIQGFVASKWDLLNLANNHSFDHGAQGLLETFNTIKLAGLNYVGAGANIEEARKPFIKEINGKKIIIYSMAESEFSIADQNTPGANPLDIINFINAIKKYKEGGTFIVLIHGGKEYYPYPTPEMVRRCRFMVDMGADAVICCHTHCPLPWEIYADRPIVYGLGNLIFESKREMLAGWYEGYLARLTINKEGIHLGVVPYVQSLTNFGSHKMDENTQKHFFDEMEKRATEVKDSRCLEAHWVEYCRRQKKVYLTGLFGCNRFVRKACSLLFRRLYAKKEVLNALHLVQCETHQEILNTIFRDERRESEK